MAFNNTVAARAAAAIWDMKLGFATMQAVLAQANTTPGGLNAVINGAFNDSFGGLTNAQVAAMVVNNLGLTGALATEGTTYLTAQLGTVPMAERGAKISEVIALYSSLSAHPTFGESVRTFNQMVSAATVYAGTPGTQDAILGTLDAVTSFNLTLNADVITGSAAADRFNAYIFDNSNSLQSGDMLDGGAGNDTLFADMGSSQAFAVTPITQGVENVVIRAQSEATAQGQNNPGASGRVQIDAERIVGATRFESNNSRSDVIIEDVRILPSQITRDITVAWVEADPGHVDYGVYFDQLSLKNQTSSSSQINLQIMDTGATAQGLAPLLNSNYGGFRFTVTPPGQPSRVVTLQSQAIQDAQTYAQLAAAFQAELNREFGAGSGTATVGANFTIVDPLSGTLVTGQNIVLSTQSATVFSTPAGSGWLAEGTAPPASNFYTNFNTAASSSADLVTVKVIVDDVGRGSTGGDLVIGGLSTGVTSSSLGVQRFEVEVRDNSKLESMKSTNNTLREVVIVNGETSSSSSAYTTTVQNAGDLTVNGNSGVNGANISTSPLASLDFQGGNNAPLPNSGATTNYGFTDVRLIDGTTMTGRLAFTAEVTNASLAKYLNLRDIQALPAGDNIAFTYNGGGNNDTMWVTLDSTATASRSTIMSGREDFTFTLNGGAGNDALTLWVNQSVAGNNNPGLVGQDQNWYYNQKLNRNLTVDGGDGNDTIRTPGAGDVIIRGGAGTDTIYADNSGAQGAVSGTASMAGAVYTAAEAAELAAVLALLNLSNSTNSGNNPAFTPLGQPNLTVAALNTLNLVTPVNYNDPAVPANPNPLLPTRAQLRTAIDNALAAEALTPAQALALVTAYNTNTGVTITIPNAITDPLGEPTLTAGVAVAGGLTSGEFAAGNALLATYIAEAEAAQATATSADATLASQLALLNATQLALVNANLAVNGVASFQAGTVNGTTTILNGLTTLRAALVLGATDAAVVAAITTAVQNQIITNAQGLNLYNAAISAGAGTIDAAELFAVQVILEPMIATATALNTTATATLAAAIAANNTAVQTAATIVGADPVLATASAVAGDAVGSAEAAAAATAAAAALTAFVNGTVTPLTTQQAGLAALKTALAVGVSDLQFSLLTAAAAAAGTITAGDAANLNALTFAAIAQNGTVSAAEKEQIDNYITALQQTNDIAVDAAIAQRALLQATVTATAFASAQAAAAAASAPANPETSTHNRAVWVLNTANQLDVTTTPGTGYVLAVNDERNIGDLRSDVNNSYNMFNTQVVVTFKGLVATATVPNTGYRTSDLQINQAIKDAINNNAVLNKLIVATDGPANTLVITSLIDGVMSVDNLSIALNLPGSTSVSSSDIAAAAAVYGVTATSDAVFAAMTAAQTAFSTKGDYVDQLAETGAFGGNVRITGANSVTTSDNTITPGDGNDVIVLGTTSGSDALLSSNDTVVYGANFGLDTIVHFRAGALSSGGDVLNLSALGGSILSTAFNVDRSITVANETVSNDTAAEVAALFADSATAQTHVYIAVDTLTNIGRVYAVVDAAGTGTGSVTATLAGTIDLADTLWGTLTADNFS